MLFRSSASPIIGALFFSSFVILGTMIILNLVIGVIINSMDETKKEQELKKKIDEGSLNSDLEHLKHKLNSLTEDIESLQNKAKQLANK